MDSNWISVTHPNVIYAGIVKRAEFDLIDLPAIDHGTTNPDRQVITKTAYHGNGGELTVVIQHWYGPTPAERAAAEAVARFRADSIASELGA